MRRSVAPRSLWASRAPKGATSTLVAEMPMTITGKVQKFVMREQMIDELGLAVAKTA